VGVAGEEFKAKVRRSSPRHFPFFAGCAKKWEFLTRAQGNEFFAKNDFSEAVKWYTKAIEAYPQGHVYYSNRCACFTSLNQLDKALKVSVERGRGGVI
jgi:tetratricopeptide (TPR) repeat protein